jgi:hypothetical protein
MDKSKLKEQFEDAFLRFEAASLALRPIAEGLAMMCELDCYAPEFDHKMYSAPMWWTAPLAAKGLPESIVTDFVNAKLNEVRRSDEYLAKRADLLASDFSCADGGYLLGYMICKAVFSRLNKTARRVTADEFLKIARYLIFSDASLASLILDTRTIALDLAALIAHRVSHRLSNFFLASDVDTRLARLRNLTPTGSRDDPDSNIFMIDVLGEEPVRPEATAELTLFNEPSEAKRYAREIQAAWQEAILPGRLPWPVPSHAYELNKFILARRELFWLCADEVLVRSQGGQIRAYLQDGRWIDGSADAIGEPIEFQGTGSLNILLSMTGQYKLDVITAGAWPISAKGADNVSPARRKVLLQIVTDRRSLEQEVRETARELEAKGQQLIGKSALLEFRKSAQQEILYKLAPLAVSAMPGADCLKFSKYAATGGWFALLSDSVLVRALALMSHCTAEELPHATIVEAMSDHGMSFADCAERIHSLASTQFGGSPLIDGGSRCVI